MKNQSRIKEAFSEEFNELEAKYNSLKEAFDVVSGEKERLVLEKLIKASQEFILLSHENPDYQKILNVMLEVSGARYASFNIFDDDDRGFSTVALAGISENITKASKLLGFDIISKHWGYDPEREKKTLSQIITQYDYLHELTGKILPKSIVKLIEKTFNIKETYIITTVKDKKILGDFTLFFKTGETLKNHFYVELYANLIGVILDRNNVTFSLSESEEKYRYMFASHPQPMFIYAIENFSIIEINQAAINKYGYTRSEFLQMSIKDLQVPGDETPWIESSDVSQDNPVISNPEIQHIKKNGDKFFVEIVSHKVELNNTKCCHVLVHDVTARKMSEAGNIFSMSLLNAALESTADGILVVNKDGIISRFNKKFTDMWQIPDGLLSDQDDKTLLDYVVSQLIHPEKFLKRIQELYDRPEESSFDLLELKENRYFERYSQAQKIGDEVVGRVWSFRDITKQKLAQNELIKIKEIAEANEKRYKTIIQSQAEGISFVNKNEVFEFANTAAEKIFEVDADELTGASLFDFLTKSGAESINQKSGHRRNGITETYEHQIITKKGNIKYIQISATPKFDENNSYLGAYGVFRDITEKRLIELQLQKYTNDLAKLNADKDQFISILAHDLKNPLHTILGFLDLLSTNLHLYDSNKIEKHINIINHSAQRVYNLLDDILLWAKSQSGKIPFEPQLIPMFATCRELVSDMKLMAESKKIEVSCEISEQLVVNADINMLKTILRNLISNSIKFTNSNGVVRIHSEETAIDVMISVSDTGMGMSSAVLEQLFDISRIYSTKGTANETGSGFGLLLCKEFIEKHGGTIRVESEEGIGSKFTFSLPKKPVRY